MKSSQGGLYMKPKICKECGKSFIPKNGMSRYCGDAHYRICVVCGQQFEVTRAELSNGDTRKTCSKKCSTDLKRQTQTEMYGGMGAASDIINTKMRQTSIQRYGTEHPAQSYECKEKTKATNLKRYGAEYYSQTQEYKDRIDEYWSDESNKIERADKVAQSNLERYGVKSTFSISEVRKKQIQTMQERYGVSYPWESEEIRQKALQTTKDRYGAEYPIQCDELKTKIDNACLDKYGYDISHILNNSEILDRAKSTCLDKYGHICYLQSEEGKFKTKATVKSKYGAEVFARCKDFGVRHNTDPSRIEAWTNFHSNPEEFLQDLNLDHKPSYKELADILGITPSSVSQIVLNYNLTDLVQRYISTMETEVQLFLSSIGRAKNIVMHDRTVLDGKEIDIYIPEYQLGIECNPTPTHNSTLSDPWGGDPKPADYHKMKTDMCEKRGIRLIHIFGYEWIHKRLIIESILKSAIHVLPNRIYARDCVLREVSSKQSSEFLECNHRQGAAQSRYRYGLYYYGELVALMTFSKVRHTIGSGKEDTTDCYELVRFCNKLNTTVVGGASRLFKHFIDEVRPNRVRSFSDRAHTTGKLYDVLGFKEHHRSSPGYMWVDAETDVAYNRVNAQKHNLKKFLNDETIDLSQSESQIMIAHGFVKVYDSGTICWEWVR